MPQVIKLGAFPFKLAFQNWANNPLFLEEIELRKLYVLIDDVLKQFLLSTL